MGMFKASLDLSELEEFVKDLDRSEELVQDMLIKTARDLAVEALSLIIDGTSVISGELKASWKIGETVVNGDSVEIDVYSDLYYAPWYEFGHRQTPGMLPYITLCYII